MDARKVWLLKHPVSADKKAEARKLKVKIVDAIFADNFKKEELYKKKSKKEV